MTNNALDVHQVHEFQKMRQCIRIFGLWSSKGFPMILEILRLTKSSAYQIVMGEFQMRRVCDYVIQQIEAVSAKMQCRNAQIIIPSQCVITESFSIPSIKIQLKTHGFDDLEIMQ